MVGTDNHRWVGVLCFGKGDRMRTCILAFLVISSLLLVGGSSLHAIEVKLIAPDGASEDYFGYSVGISGNYALVGATWDDSQRGSAYLYKWNGSTWTLHKKLTASDRAAGDIFGCHANIDGDYAIIGARWDDSGLGAAYVFYKDQGGSDNWGEQAKLVASDGVAGDAFGTGVDISGQYAVIGGAYGGKAYIFKRTGATWSELARLSASDHIAGDYFGAHLAIDGYYALVAAPYDDENGTRSGIAYIFQKDQGGADNWGQQAKLIPLDGDENDIFGSRVGLSGEYAVIGALWDDDKGIDSGSAYVFHRSGTTWSQQVKLTASDGAAYDQFGRGVAISGDYIIVGADADNSIYSFLHGGGSWYQVSKQTPSGGGGLFGWIVAISGNDAIVGAHMNDNSNGTDAGAAYLYHCINDLSLPVELSSFTASYGDNTVTLRWTTQTETENLGFHVYRSLTENGAYERITASLIPGAGSSWTPHSYQFTDQDVQEGVTYYYKLEQIDAQGTKEMFGPKIVRILLRIQDMAIREIAPARYALHQNAPNPFNPSTTIAYDLPQACDVTLTVYTITGQPIAVLVDAPQEAGWHTAIFDGSGVANGVYLYRLGTERFVETRRMMLLK